MADIALPQISDSARRFIRVPLAPHNPPNNGDIVAAAQLVRDLAKNFADQNANEGDLASAIKYATLLNADTMEDLPPRFRQAINTNVEQFFNDAFEDQIPARLELRIHTTVTDALAASLPQLLAPMNDTLTRMETKMTRMETKITGIVTKLTRVQILLAKMFNRSQSSGPDVQYMIVLFPDGRDPTEQPNALPPLDSIEAIKDLNDQYARRYVQAYYPNENFQGLGPPARLLRIVAAIGVHPTILV